MISSARRMSIAVAKPFYVGREGAGREVREQHDSITAQDNRPRQWWGSPKRTENTRRWDDNARAGKSRGSCGEGAACAGTLEKPLSRLGKVSYVKLQNLRILPESTEVKYSFPRMCWLMRNR
jgi:hypothetical protein